MDKSFDDSIIRGYLEGQARAHRVVDGWIRLVVASRHWGLHQDRDDIVQEVRRRLFESLTHGRFRGASSLKTYVVQMTKFVCIEFLRRKVRDNEVRELDEVHLTDPAPGPEQRLAESERVELARKAMASLPDRCRELFRLIFVDRLSYHQIGDELGIAPGTVKSRASRCRDALSKILEKNQLAAKQPGVGGKTHTQNKMGNLSPEGTTKP